MAIHNPDRHRLPLRNRECNATGEKGKMRGWRDNEPRVLEAIRARGTQPRSLINWVNASNIEEYRNVMVAREDEIES